MGQRYSRFVRLEDSFETENISTDVSGYAAKFSYDVYETKLPRHVTNKVATPKNTKKHLKSKSQRRVFAEDYVSGKSRILDPRGKIIHRWNEVFLAACLVSLFVDPLFFLVPKTTDSSCLKNGTTLEVVITIIRSVTDLFYVIQIFIRFHTAYVAPSSRIFGRGELVVEPSKIAARYFRKGFWLDLLISLPLPQVLIWVVIPTLGGSMLTSRKSGLFFIMIIQFLPRLFLIYPLTSKIMEATGVVSKTAWAGATFNLLLYLLSSHVSGACWYLLALERQEACWKYACGIEAPNCTMGYFNCRNVEDPARVNWFQTTNVTTVCNPGNGLYPFGIYGGAVTNNASSSDFIERYFYVYWWGLMNLSSFGNNLITSTFVGELIFTLIVSSSGLILFSLLIGNVQRYLESTTARLEEWRIKRTDTERWMYLRELPPDLRQSIREYDQYKWAATRGVDEEELLNGLPLDLRREIKRHLCLNLVRRVPVFDKMDEALLDAICERLKPALWTRDMFLVREGDPVTQMLFIIRGHLNSYTTGGGRMGFFNSSRIGPTDFCGEELLTWALDPDPNIILPLSTRTVKAITEGEAFYLDAEDVRFVASQFRELHSRRMKNTFRFYSHQWRTWGACYIQAAWRKHKTLKELDRLRASMEREAPRAAGLYEASCRFSFKKPPEPDF